MANQDLVMSNDGLQKLKDDEGVIGGLYDDPSGYCTFGVGHLVHQSDKWPCFLMSVASADDVWSKNVAKMWAGKSYETPYLTCPTAFMDKFEALKTKAVEAAEPLIAKKRYGKDLDKLAASEKANVNTLAKSVIDEQAKLLAKTPDGVLKEDLIPFEKTVRDTITPTLVQDEFDALVSLCFNIGQPAFRSSGVVKEINKDRHKAGASTDRKAAIDAIEKAFQAWNKSAGVVLDGLTKRRQSEANRFLLAARTELAELDKKAVAGGAKK